MVQGPVEYINVVEDAKGDGVWGDHVSRAGTSVRILALIAICVSVSVTSYLSGGKEDVHSCVSALRLGLECSKGEISQWRHVGHQWSTCCKPMIVLCLFITCRTPLMPWSKMYFLASPRFRLPSLRLKWASSNLSNWACTCLISVRRRYAQLAEIWTHLGISSGK